MGPVATLALALALTSAGSASAQPGRPYMPSLTGPRGQLATGSVSRNGTILRPGASPIGRNGYTLGSPLGRGSVLGVRPGSTKRSIIIPGQGTPSRGPIIRPGETRADPNRRIIRPGERQRPDPNRRIIRPGEGDPPSGRTPQIVTVNGSSVRSMAAALRSVGEFRLASALCRQAGGCGRTSGNGSGSPRALNANARRGAVNIRLPVDTRRVIYSANNRFAANEDAEDGAVTEMPRLTRVHGRNDPIAQRAYDKAGVILSFYRTILGRRSYDDRNAPTRFVVHYGYDNDNAAWNAANESTFGEPIAVFGDGNETSRSQVEGDIAYHEFTHGVVDYSSGFVYEGEPGALHEHFADALGETAQQWERGESVRSSEWLFGERTYHLASREGATRSFANPMLYGQPAHMRDAARVDRNEDNGGVHTLSGIPNRAFYVASTRLGGHTWEHTGLIWYSALRDHLGPNANFRDCARATMRSAAELFGPNSREARAVRAGWADVGIRLPLYRERPGEPMHYGGTPPANPGEATDPNHAAEAARR